MVESKDCMFLNQISVMVFLVVKESNLASYTQSNPRLCSISFNYTWPSRGTRILREIITMLWLMYWCLIRADLGFGNLQTWWKPIGLDGSWGQKLSNTRWMFGTHSIFWASHRISMRVSNPNGHRRIEQLGMHLQRRRWQEKPTDSKTNRLLNAPLHCNEDPCSTCLLFG